MRFFIDRHRFVHEVQHVVKAVSSRTPIPILTGIKITVDQQGVTLTGSDSDISIETFIPAEEDDSEIVKIEEVGSIVLQARLFSEIVRKLPGEEIEIDVRDRFETKIQSGSSVFNLNGLNPDEYPRLPQLEENLLFRLPENILKNTIHQTVFAVSTQETRPVLTGVNFDMEDGVLNCTATDSHRLAMRKVSIEQHDESFTFSNVVIPGRSLLELSKILGDSSDLIDIVVTNTQVLFKVKNLLFYSRLLEGKYPVTKNMIPTQSKTSIHVKTKDFHHTLERALLLSREEKNNVVHFKTLNQSEVEITSISAEIGRVTENIEIQKIEGEEMQISFNGKNVIDALKAIDSDDIVISFTGAMSPFVIRPHEHDHYLHLFSPVRTY